MKSLNITVIISLYSPNLKRGSWLVALSLNQQKNKLLLKCSRCYVTCPNSLYCKSFLDKSIESVHKIEMRMPSKVIELVKERSIKEQFIRDRHLL